MREDICSIPVNDVFIPKMGCPFCTMRDMLEDRIATYITGAAMMEPDVREETNRLGFCRTHYDHILARGSRLSVALILESLVIEVQKEVFPEGKITAKKEAETVNRRTDSCFICENVDKNMHHLTGSMIKMWESDAGFRTLYEQQPHICLRHYGMVIADAQKMNRKNFSVFASVTARLSRQYLDGLSKDVTHFCRMFDYRNKGADWGNSKDAIERSIEYLTARKPEVHQRAEEKNR